MFRRAVHSTAKAFAPRRGVWDLLRPSNWHPAAALEQSLLEGDKLERQLMKSLKLIPWGWNLEQLEKEEREFFQDFPDEYEGKATKEAAKDTTTTLPYANYSYSSAYLVDSDGRRVESVRRRYEDSTGRLKAMHARDVNGRKMLSKWNREQYSDKGTHEVKCSTGTPEEFEELWQSTPFAKEEKAIELGEPKPKKDTEQALPLHASPTESATA
ncbi:hypothetical protein, variant [Aphanomyces astaci]|uniref:Uncharacterized protein n=1 Tax=Aphanomyces astaci TaxID=112090 RepID=W4GTS0_APHAT|nr:hypothetical protein, variant [Aphanomyces astaci]ETV82419.1 hypothetical protein, variant [Aphanomyces astaci]RHY15940.1 hypothetical protein DYB25_000964 [Aphanomyces astaci]RHY54840.1 hypothetical protein DYB34_001175 [Aphanomyces astaci]RHY74200.1 hypothetical protein DYB30_002449 [Aphanomyces astaci]RHY80003.1 hypothetical protein DYB26_014387 [Aphanomyces astaci]|eukprot:XP_009828088.1 hypothetical protein, variant [Aphanomyces astaci]